MVEIDERILDTFIIASELSVDDLKSLGLLDLEKTVKDESLTFEPNKNLGEGKASERNLDSRQLLLTCLKDTVYDPMTTLLKSDKTTEEQIKAIDGFIDDYIKEGQILLEDSLTKSWNIGLDESETNLKKAAKKTGCKL